LIHAAGRADKLLENGDTQGALIWRAIAGATELLPGRDRVKR
jgi:hypothetical protein